MVILTEVDLNTSSSSTYDPKYDVFLSFRGVDTRHNFTNHLHKALISADLATFLDDEEIATGNYLKPELESAIKASRASVIVLSKNYASSTWCLDELVLILEQHRNSNHIVIPIFYHVEPTDVRKQQNSFKDAMLMHTQKMEAETNVEERSRLAEKIEIWKNALTQVSNLKGKDAKDRMETEFIEEIVKDIYQGLGDPLWTCLPLLIGMEGYIKTVNSWLRDGSSNNTNILTIVGMGGIGKTSLARYVYGLHRHEFTSWSFVEDISRRCAQSNGLLDVQKQLCDDISKKQSIQHHHVSGYTAAIQTLRRDKKVILVLDDIDSLDQLDALLGNKSFHPGSKIIITTKDASLTEKCALFNPQVKPVPTNLLVRGLDETASLELLCLHAFKFKHPKAGYKKVSRKLVKYCDGHPLALEVLGRSLQNRDVDYWEDCIEGLKKESHSHIKKALQMSFDSLPSKNDKDLFKHIACFFVGKDRYFTELILKSCDINTNSGITNLIDRCLVSIRSNNELTMHSLIQDMGRDTVRLESPDQPWKRSRLWCHEETFNMLKRKKGTENILGFTLDMRMIDKEKLRGSFELKTDALSKMDNLMLLQLNYVQLNGSYENISEELRWLCLHGFPLKSIPSEIQMENLVVLDMSYSNIESFGMSYESRQKFTESSLKDNRLLGSLKILDLRFCKQLHSVGGFFELPSLDRLILTNCTSLIQVSESIAHCVELVYIDLSSCHRLKKLPKSLGKLKKVETLLLNDFVHPDFAIEMRNMNLLETLKTRRIGINSEHTSSAIVEVVPRNMLSFMISLPRSLVHLSLKNNNLSTESFPMDFSSLSMLTKLYLDGNPIVSMPSCVRSLLKLEILSMNNCIRLKTVEHPPRALRELAMTVTWDDMGELNKVLFDQEMSPLRLKVTFGQLRRSSFEIQGMVKTQPLVDVEKKIFHSLGWINLDSIQNQQIKTYGVSIGPQRSQVQMYYEFGIFSTLYRGEHLPQWISHRRAGSSISYTIPSSPNKLIGMNICSVQTCLSNEHEFAFLPLTIVKNITKNQTWIYNHYVDRISVMEECMISLSHWMFRKNEIEDGDQLTIILGKKNFDFRCMEARECGISLVYDDGSMEEEDPLGYYKSWNNIIGGDLSGFQTTAGEYVLFYKHFMTISKRMPAYIRPFVEDDVHYRGIYGDKFRALSQTKFEEVNGAPQVSKHRATTTCQKCYEKGHGTIFCQFEHKEKEPKKGKKKVGRLEKDEPETSVAGEFRRRDPCVPKGGNKKDVSETSNVVCNRKTRVTKVGFKIHKSRVQVLLVTGKPDSQKKGY